MVISGIVRQGRHLGRELGFPTANIEIARDDIRPGVYHSRIEVRGVYYNGVTNIGVNPTVGHVDMRAESYILDFDDDIYDERIVVELLEFVREEVRFDSVEALRAQIARDVEYVKSERNLIK